MDFSPSPRAQQWHARLAAFMDRYLLPYNAAWHQAAQQGNYPPPFLQDLKQLAKEEGLWNLFLPDLRPDEPGTALSHLDYAPLAEHMGRLPWAAEVFNCNAPDSGNMELLHRFASEAQRQHWLMPLLRGEIRSAFAMSEPDVASSDPTNLQTTVRQDGDGLVLNGRKWFITGAAHPHCRLLIVMARNEGDAADAHHRHSLVLVPMDTPGVQVVRNIPVVHHLAPDGHCEILLRQVHVPRASLLGSWGEGFAMAQVRLGPGRVHHCMRTIGQCELALALATERTLERQMHGRLLAEQSNVQDWLAESRIEIEQARLWYQPHLERMHEDFVTRNADLTVEEEEAVVEGVAGQVRGRVPHELLRLHQRHPATDQVSRIRRAERVEVAEGELFERDGGLVGGEADAGGSSSGGSSPHPPAALPAGMS